MLLLQNVPQLTLLMTEESRMLSSVYDGVGATKKGTRMCRHYSLFSCIFHQVYRLNYVAVGKYMELAFQLRMYRMIQCTFTIYAV